MSMIGKFIPNLIMQEIASVQPISDDAYNGIYKMCAMSESHKYKFGELIHSFLHGWLVFDGISFITADQFIRWFGKDKIIKSRREIYRKMRDIL